MALCLNKRVLQEPQMSFLESQRLQKKKKKSALVVCCTSKRGLNRILPTEASQ